MRSKLTLFLGTVVMCLLCSGLNAETHSRIRGVDFRYRPLQGTSALQDQDFYLLTVLESSNEALQALAANKDMEAIWQDVVTRAQAAESSCESVILANIQKHPDDRKEDCSPNALRWTDAERKRAAEAFGYVYDSSPVVRRLVVEHLRPSGRFQLYAGLDDRALAVKAWTDAQEDIDRIIRVYALGEAPRYADIDSVIYPLNGHYYRTLLLDMIREVARHADRPGPVYDLARDFALELMDANRRDDAVRQLLLQEQENAAAYSFLAHVPWDKYDYAAVLVPGWSPEIEYEPLNPGAKLRLQRGVELFLAKRAPVIIVSGGRLRPIGTQLTEALEMKRFLMSHFGIPENRILIDPLARHTTTNLRNAARLLFRVGAPAEKKSLVIDETHYISSPGFAARCQRDFGYIPFTVHTRLDFDTLEFSPSLTSLHREASDPMDP